MRKNNQSHKVDQARTDGSRRSGSGAASGELRQTKNDWKNELERDTSTNAIAEEDEEQEDEGGYGSDDGSKGVPASPGTPGLGLFVSAIKTPALDPQHAAGPGDDFNL